MIGSKSEGDVKLRTAIRCILPRGEVGTGRLATNMKEEQDEEKDMTDKKKEEEKYDSLPYFHWPTGSFVLANQNLRYNIGNFLLRPVQI